MIIGHAAHRYDAIFDKTQLASSLGEGNRVGIPNAEAFLKKQDLWEDTLLLVTIGQKVIGILASFEILQKIAFRIRTMRLMQCKIA
jgi:hypothetical protein